jgi:hypothetical protein
MRKTALVFFAAFCAAVSAQAFVVKTATILSKLAENNGSGIYTIEDEVQLGPDVSTQTLKESWTVMDDIHMKVVVTGPGIRWVYVYDNGTRYQNTNGTKKSKAINESFLERYFHIRKADRLQKAFSHVGIPMEEAPQLIRVGGVVGLALGSATDSATAEDKPLLVIEQDQFVLRKLRLASQAEMTADKYSPYGHGLQFPKLRTIRWGFRQGSNTGSLDRQEKVATIQTLHVQSKVDKKLVLNIEPSQGQLADPHLQSMAEEFYQRFR